MRIENESYYSNTDDNSDIEEAIPYQFEPLALRVENLGLNEDVDEEEERVGNVNWCSCDHCTPMPSIKESVCCQETHIQNKIIEFNEDGGDISCITQHPGFQPVCLDRYVLETAYYQYRQQYDELELSENERQRYVAYRQLVRWCWGFLGKDIRVVLPSCAVTRIRQEYPSQEYRGFEDAA